MAYGTLSSTIRNHYNKINYNVGGVQYENIHVFKTNPSTETITPAVHTNGSKKKLGSMNPPNVDASKVMAKTNGNVMSGTTTSGDAFYGIFYVNNKLYQNGVEYSSYTGVSCSYRGYPCFCIKTDGSVAIRWFESNYKLSIALPYCASIISGSAALVFDSKNVFQTNVQSDDNHVIYNVNNPSASDSHYDSNKHNNSETWPCARTFLGHKSDGSFLLVVCEEMRLFDGAKLMCDLGCDYAINLDGSSPSQMRVASGYLNNVTGVTAGKVTSTGSDNYYYGTAVIAHKK